MAPKTGKKKRKAAAAEAGKAAAEAEGSAAEGLKKQPTEEAADAGKKPPAAEKPAKKKEASGAAAAKGPAPEKKREPEVADEQRPEDAFSAAAVVFHTRGEDDKVSKILVAVEERKVQASYIGLNQTGKISQRMALFPMGRREKKDKADSVETARREYIEETGDFGGLAKYLDFADFDGGPDGEAEPRAAETWTGRHNMAVFFAPARMIVLFCEVPAAAALSADRAASGGVPLSGAGAAAASAAPAAAAEGGEERQPKKKRKKAAAEAQMNQNGTRATYKVGRTDHLAPTWLDAAVLRGLVASGERSPILKLLGEECRLFPTAASVLRLPEVRSWLGVPAAAGEAEGPA